MCIISTKRMLSKNKKRENMGTLPPVCDFGQFYHFFWAIFGKSQLDCVNRVDVHISPFLFLRQKLTSFLFLFARDISRSEEQNLENELISLVLDKEPGSKVHTINVLEKKF